MELEQLKKYLQVYLDDVVSPKMNKELVGDGDEQISLNVYAVRKGSYQPPIYHFFIDINPNWKGSVLNKIDREIQNFMKMFSIPFKIKIHWNKRPLF